MKTMPATSVRLTDRDICIMETIHAFDGVLSQRQIDRLFFGGYGASTARHRLRLLCQHGYLKRPTSEQAHRVPRGETVYWLGRRGAQQVAGLVGEKLSTFKWCKQPRWSLIRHEVKAADVRIAILESCTANPRLTLTTWLPESSFRRDPDTIQYQSGRRWKCKRRIIPDGFFVINHTYAYLLEVDMGSEHHPRFGREKVLPGLAYLKSDAYRKRFGLRYGRWLVVTTGTSRMHTMRRQATRLESKKEFYFTTFDQLAAGHVFAAPIWWAAQSERPTALL